MANSESNIPTLTNIVHPGDEDMFNHFDAHQFEQLNENDIEATALENASDFENSEIDEVPSIKLERENTTQIPDQDFSEAMQLKQKKTATNTSPASKSEIKKKIDTAIAESMPAIEKHLKAKLYKQFGI